MKTVDYRWDHPDLKSFRKTAKKGEWLFSQGENGRSMMIIIQGIVQLTAERDGKNLAMALVGAGEFLGEKAIFWPDLHRRFFGAYACTDLVYLELTTDDIDTIDRKNPALLKDILRQMFVLAARRLDQTNYLVRVLRSSDNVTRLVNLLAYLARCSGPPTPDGNQVRFTVDEIRYYIDMSPFEIEECLKVLLERKILTQRSENLYLISSFEAILGTVDLLKNSLPSLRAID